MSAAAAVRIVRHPRRALAVWAGLLLLLIAAAFGGTRLLDAHVERQLARSPWTYVKASERMLSSNDWRGALEALAKGAQVAPESPLPHERTGLIYYTQNEWEDALAAFRRAIERGSASEDVHGKTVWCLIQLGEYTAAQEFGEACIARGFSSPYFPRFIGEALRRAGDPAGAIPWFERAVPGFPGDLLLMERLAQTYDAAGRPALAQEWRARIRDQEGG